MNRTDIDPVTLSTIWHTFRSICGEMRSAIERTAQNYLMSQLHDIAGGIWDAEGRTIAVPVGPVGQILGQHFSIRYMLNKFGEDLHPGDLILNNDPYHGGCNHLPDWGFFRPIFYKDELLFFTLARGHQMDTGGAHPGAYFPDAYDIHAEGICIPPTKVFEKGRERRDVMELIFNNVRFPEAMRVDVYALIGATRICENRILAMLDRYGRNVVMECVQEMFSRTEKAVRAEITNIPDGTFYGESAADDDGTQWDQPVWVRCEAKVAGDEITLDFSRSDLQRKGFVNSSLPNTYSRAVAGCFLFFSPSLADYHNEGSLRPVHLIAPEGSVVHAKYPATVGGSPVSVGTQILEATVMALSQALPQRSIAAWGRHRGHYFSGTDPRSGAKYLFTTFDSDGGAGAVYGYDGYEGAATMPTLASIQRGNVEEEEIRFPWRVLRYQMSTDLEGAGKWRGAAGVVWEALNEGSAGSITTGSADGERTQGPGALGGHPTPLSTAVLRRGDSRLPLQSKRLFQHQPGDILTKFSGGGAGIGDPAERDPEKVRSDVLNGVISPQRAREVYGVVLNPDTLEVDQAQTVKLRGK